MDRHVAHFTLLRLDAGPRQSFEEEVWEKESGHTKWRQQQQQQSSDEPPVPLPTGPSPFRSPVGDVVKKLTPGGLGVLAVLVASSAPAAYQSAFGMLALFGTLICVGIALLDKPMLFHPLAFILGPAKLSDISQLGTDVGLDRAAGKYVVRLDEEEAEDAAAAA
ncbi:MAG: hypothetical protein STHCBS139747_001881 [Sporothrix thermara]